MAKRLSIPSKQLQMFLVGAKNKLKIARVQSLALNTDNPATTMDEIGSASHTGDIKEVPNVTLTFSAFDVGVKIWSVLTGTDWTAYPSAGVDIGLLGEVDAIFYVKDHNLAVYAKSAHARRLQIRDVNFNYSVDGESTEDYSAVGSKRRWLKYDVVCDVLSSTGTSHTLSKTPIQLKNGDYALSVIADGEYLDEVTTAPSTGEYRIVGTTLTTGDAVASQVIVCYHSDADGAWTDVSDTDVPAAIRGKDVYITISANSIARVQSVSITGNLNPQVINEMGNPEKIVGYQSQVPQVEGTITVLDTDTDLISLFTYGVLGSGAEWSPGEDCTTTALSLKVELKDPCDATVVLKTVYLDDISMVGDGYAVNVNGQAQWAINYRSNTGHLVVYSGAMP